MIQAQTVALGMPSRGDPLPRLVISAHGGRILAADEESALLTGYTVEELRTLRLGDLLGRQEYSEVMAFLEHSLLSGGGELAGIHLHGRNGSTRTVTIAVEVEEDDLGTFRGISALQHAPWPSALRCYLEDITERERLGREIKQDKQALSGLQSLAGSVAPRAPRPGHELQQALVQILRMLGLEMGGLYVTDSSDREGPFALKAAEGMPPGSVESQAMLAADDGLLQSMSSVGKQSNGAGRSYSLLVRERVSTSSRVLPEIWRQAGVRAFMAQPLGAADRPIGLLLVGTSQARQFSSRDRDLLELSCHQLSMAVENALLLQELRERVEDLSAVRQLSANVLRDMSDGLLMVDVEGRITTLNQAAEKILGCTATRLQGQPLSTLAGEDGRFAVLVRKAIDQGTPRGRSELVVRRADGRPVPVGASIALLRSGSRNHDSSTDSVDAEVTGAVVVFTDLTEQKHAEEERRHQDRLALLGEWNAVLAHEVRNPLAGIVHGIQYVAEELSPEGEAAQSVRYILEESRRISNLLEETLLISRPHEPSLEPCDLPGILEGLLLYWRAQAAARGVEVRTHYTEDIAAPLGDADRLKQVFVNLISNALDAMPDGGTLWLRVRPAQLSSVLTGHGNLPAVRVEVEDTGIGIPAHAMQRVYDRFFTTKEGGTGLGLAISQRIVQDHRGKIDVHSEEGKGTLFTVYLPLEASEVYEAQPGPLSS